MPHHRGDPLLCMTQNQMRVYKAYGNVPVWLTVEGALQCTYCNSADEGCLDSCLLANVMNKMREDVKHLDAEDARRGVPITPEEMADKFHKFCHTPDVHALVSGDRLYEDFVDRHKVIFVLQGLGPWLKKETDRYADAGGVHNQSKERLALKCERAIDLFLRLDLEPLSEEDTIILSNVIETSGYQTLPPAKQNSIEKVLDLISIVNAVKEMQRTTQVSLFQQLMEEQEQETLLSPQAPASNPATKSNPAPAVPAGEVSTSKPDLQPTSPSTSASSFPGPKTPSPSVSKQAQVSSPSSGSLGSQPSTTYSGSHSGSQPSTTYSGSQMTSYRESQPSTTYSGSQTTYSGSQTTYSGSQPSTTYSGSQPSTTNSGSQPSATYSVSQKPPNTYSVSQPLTFNVSQPSKNIYGSKAMAVKQSQLPQRTREPAKSSSRLPYDQPFGENFEDDPAGPNRCRGRTKAGIRCKLTEESVGKLHGRCAEAAEPLARGAKYCKFHRDQEPLF